MVREIQRLKQRIETLEEENRTFEERNDGIKHIIGSLQNDAQGMEIIHRLKRGEEHRDVAEWLGRLMKESTTQLSPIAEVRVSEATDNYDQDFVNSNDRCYWTKATMDPYMIEYLINLYLTWIHPAHMLFDQGKFMAGFRDRTDPHCSSSLVNAICAMSCQLVHDKWSNSEDMQATIRSLRIRFLDEAQSLLKGTDNNELTAIQTYAIIFLVELSCGNGEKASSHLRLAAELLIKKQQAEQFRESEEISFWGLLTLHT